ncbi:MAG: PQQ-binding-like beta-propeller repeat protein [Candidatus Micrarchaeota archaeon]
MIRACSNAPIRSLSELGKVGAPKPWRKSRQPHFILIVIGKMWMKKTSLLLLLLVFISSVSAQIADSAWPVFHGDIRGTGLSTYNTSAVEGTVLWKFKTERGIEASPILAEDGTIYIPAHDCDLYAINPNGTKKWQFDGGEPVYSKEWDTWSCAQSTPAVSKDGTIYYVTMANWLIAVNPNGTEKWRYQVHLFKNVWTSPTVAPDGTIYVGSENYPPHENGKEQEIGGTLYALNSDGTLKWKYDTGSSGVSSTAVIASDGTIITAGGCYDESIDTFSSCVYAFNSDGSIKWKFLPDGVVEGSAVIGADETIYIGVKGKINPKNGKFYALTPDGKEKWKFLLDSGMSVSPAIGEDGTIYFGDWGGVFYALTPEGKEVWKVQTPESFESLSSSPAISADGTIYFGSLAGYFFAYTLDGKEKWRIEEGRGGFISSPAISKEGIVYAATVPGELLAIGGGNGSTTLSEVTSSGTMAGDYYDKTCPKHIYRKEENLNELYAVLGDEKWDLTLTRQIDWISNNCPDTIWPDGSKSKPKLNISNMTTYPTFEQSAFCVSDEHFINARFFGETARSCLDASCTEKKETCVRWNKHMDNCYSYGEICTAMSCSNYKVYCEIAIVNNENESVDVTFNSEYQTGDGVKHFLQSQSFSLEPNSGNALTWEYDVDAENAGTCIYTELKVNGKEKKNVSPYCQKETIQTTETKEECKENCSGEANKFVNKTIKCGDGICDVGEESSCQDDCGGESFPSTKCGNGVCEIGEENICHDDCSEMGKNQGSDDWAVISFLKRLFNWK